MNNEPIYGMYVNYYFLDIYNNQIYVNFFS